jgi:hypothetical protein
MGIPEHAAPTANIAHLTFFGESLGCIGRVMVKVGRLYGIVRCSIKGKSK